MHEMKSCSVCREKIIGANYTGMHTYLLYRRGGRNVSQIFLSNRSLRMWICFVKTIGRGCVAFPCESLVLRGVVSGAGFLTLNTKGRGLSEDVRASLIART